MRKSWALNTKLSLCYALNGATGSIGGVLYAFEGVREYMEDRKRTMTKRECEFEELVQFAYRHTLGELGLENIKPSFRLEFESLQKAHDAINEFMLLAPLLFPSQANAEFHRKSAFLLPYQGTAFDHAHRSLIESLCGYYNVAFVLLRTTLELVIKGAFWECLSHKEYRQSSQVLDKDDRGKKIKEWLNEIFNSVPNVEEVFETISASIYDKIRPVIEEAEFRPGVKTIVRQLSQWGIFNPIPDPTTSVYEEIYGRLSADVHVVPDRTDIGQRMLDPSSQILEQEILQNTLSEYAHCLHQVMDLAILVELNILRDLIEEYDEAKANLSERLETLEQLGLEYSLKRAKELVR
jgi:hypothetical protein